MPIDQRCQLSSTVSTYQRFILWGSNKHGRGIKIQTIHQSVVYRSVFVHIPSIHIFRYKRYVTTTFWWFSASFAPQVLFSSAMCIPDCRPLCHIYNFRHRLRYEFLGKSSIFKKLTKVLERQVVDSVSIVMYLYWDSSVA